MCGFAGLLTTRDDRRREIPSAVKRMTDAIVHRGPDDVGVWHDADRGVGLGFRRLSILDLSPNGHQPMRSESGRFTMVFNGEVYNHGDLRTELASKGHQFRGHSDTEVILAAFEVWGVKAAIPRFAGMFAIALWDSESRVLTLMRDRLGKKPLFVHAVRGLVLFGSELKSFVADPGFARIVDTASVHDYLRYLYVPAPASIFQNTGKVLPGHLLEIRDAEAPLPESTPYWDHEAVAERAHGALVTDERLAVAKLESLLEEATRQRLESDVPLGALLSGGIDSSLVVALMQRQVSKPVRTYTIGFDDPEFDESAHAAQVAKHLGTDHTTLSVTGAEALAVVPELPRIFDEPLADPSQVPTLLVSRLARRDVTVALCGDGGDEVFGGYNRYVHGPQLLSQIGAVPTLIRRPLGQALLSVPVGTWDALARAATLPLGASSRPRLAGERLHKIGRLCGVELPGEGYRSLMSAWQEPHEILPHAQPRADRALAVMRRHSGFTVAERMMLADQLTYLPDDLLAKADRASMSASLELRSPLLDHRVLEFAWSLPQHMKIRGGTTKWVLRELLARHVPRAVFERPKMGFSVPVRSWLTGPLRPWAEDLLSPSTLAELPMLDARAVRNEWALLCNGRSGNGLALWALLQLVAWWREWRPTVG